MACACEEAGSPGRASNCTRGWKNFDLKSKVHYENRLCAFLGGGERKTKFRCLLGERKTKFRVPMPTGSQNNQDKRPVLGSFFARLPLCPSLLFLPFSSFSSPRARKKQNQHDVPLAPRFFSVRSTNRRTRRRRCGALDDRCVPAAFLELEPCLQCRHRVEIPQLRPIRTDAQKVAERLYFVPIPQVCVDSIHQGIRAFTARRVGDYQKHRQSQLDEL